MEFHRGRLIDHIHLLVANIEKSKQFYRAILNAFGQDFTGEGDDYFFIDELFVSQTSGLISQIHLAFQAPNPATVRRFYEVGLAAGGRDNSPPDERHYHPGYYAAYLFDPDGNNIEAVYHGPAQRSAQSVIITSIKNTVGG